MIIMYQLLSFSISALFLLITCEVHGFLPNQPATIERRLVCLEDDFYFAFREYDYDAVPYCKQFLGINDTITTIPAQVTERTSVSVAWNGKRLILTHSRTKVTTVTSYNTVTVDSTEAVTTQVLTETVTLPPLLRKRNPQDPTITSGPSNFYEAVPDAEAALEARDSVGEDVCSSFSSACSCLSVLADTFTIISTPKFVWCQDLKLL